MPQSNPKLIDLDFAPAKDRRSTTPMACAIAPASEEGATGEIRSLMDQLQQTANEARHRLRAVEEERDSLSERVEMLQQQTEDLRGRASEAEDLQPVVTRLEEQRDELERRLVEARHELESARQVGRNTTPASELQSHELRRTVDSLNRTVQELNERMQGTQNQLMTLRQARDAAQNQNRELAQKLAQVEDELADWQDRLERSAMERMNEAANWAGERMALQSQMAELQARPPAAPAPSETELEEIHAARDSALAEAAALRAQVERLRQSGEEGPSLEAHESLRRERDSISVQVQIATKEVIELREQLRLRAAELEAQKGAGQSIAREAQEARAQFTTLAEEREAAFRARDEALTSLASAQKQIERVGKERDLLRDNGTENALSLEKQLEEFRASQEEGRQEKRDLTARLEAQRLETIELGARLQAAQDQVRTLSANLAEARLLAKGASVRQEPPSAPPPLPAAVGSTSETESPRPALAATPPPGPSAAPLEVVHFPGGEAYTAVRAMRRCYQAYTKNPDDLSHLNEFHCAAHSFAEQAREGGCLAVHRLGNALATLVQELYHFPEQITSEVLTTIVQSIEFLTALLKVKDLRSLKDPATSSVCVIDDDTATRECIIMAMESVMVQTISYCEPSEALYRLATAPCDLIVLDVRMPGMDGFELCSAIRQHSLHKHTPVIFVTGQSGDDIRAQATLHGGNDFLTKPFLLADLSLKALMMMVRTELHMAI